MFGDLRLRISAPAITTALIATGMLRFGYPF
jgi:hypothetical protein